MTFYNNRVSIADVDGKEIYLIKGFKNELILNYYSYDGERFESLLANDFLVEFDILINEDKAIHLVYQDLEESLNLLILKGYEKTIHKIPIEDLPRRLYEVNILKHKGIMSLFYLYPMDKSLKRFQIEHNMFKENKWNTFQVDEARVSQILNPIKLIYNDESIYLGYYYENQICIKCFSIIEEEWQETLVLTDNKEKLYLDLLFDGKYFHLVYSEAMDDNYSIKYINFEYPLMIKEYSTTISRKSNPTNPTIILKDDILWVVWNESSRIYSRYSDNKGKTWSDIKAWDEFVGQNILRYKYISNNYIGGTIIHNTFGTIYPDIRFIGFC